MGDVLFVWTAAYQTCLTRACVPRLPNGLYQLFDPRLIKHVLTVSHQTVFDAVWSPNISRLCGALLIAAMHLSIQALNLATLPACHSNKGYNFISVGIGKYKSDSWP